MTEQPTHPSQRGPEPNLDPALVASLAAQARQAMAANPYIPPAVRRARALEAERAAIESHRPANTTSRVPTPGDRKETR